MEKQRNRKKYIQVLLQIIIYVLVGYYILKKLSGNWNVFEQIEEFSVGLFLLSIFTFAFHSLWNSIVWHHLINESQNLSLKGQMDVYLRSHILRYIPGNVIGITSRSLFNRVYGVPMLKTFFGWCYENLVYFIIASILASFILIRNNTEIFLFILLLFFGLIFTLKVDWFENIFKKFLVHRLPKKIKKETEVLALSMNRRIYIFLGFGVSWMIYSISFLLLVASIQPALLDNNILELVSINAFAWVIGYISFITPSGSGVRELTMVFALEKFLGIDAQIAVIIAVLARIIFILGELCGFGLFFSVKYLAILLKSLRKDYL